MSAPAKLFSDDFDAPCADCGTNTTPGQRHRYHAGYGGRWELYVVHDDLWRAAGMDDGYLCVGCLERRIGRHLTPADFADVPLNEPNPNDTPRLAARKAGR
jgi:hypothetical protein